MPMPWAPKPDPANAAASATPKTAAPQEPMPEPGLVIKVPKSHTLDREGTTMRLPEIVLEPKNRDLPPELTSVQITGESVNTNLSHWLTKSYAPAIAKLSGKLTEATILKPVAIPWPEDERIPSPTDLDFHFLKIAVLHKPRNAEGKLLATPVHVPPSEIKLYIGATLAPSHTLTVQPRHLVKVYEESDESYGPTLTIRLERNAGTLANKATPVPDAKLRILPDDAAGLKTLTASWGCPTLSTTLENLLAQIQGAAKNLPDGTVVIQIQPQFTLSTQERRTLNERLRQSDAEPLWVPIRIQGTGALPKRLLLELIPIEKSNIQHGKITCDLGTSSSLAVRYDPQFVKRTIFPSEQLEQLRTDFTAFLDNPPKEIVASSQSYWLALCQSICDHYNWDGTRDPVKAVLEKCRRLIFSSQRDQEAFFELIRQYELKLWSLEMAEDDPDERKLSAFQERVGEQMYAIYHQAFEKVTLEQWGVRLSTISGQSPFISSDLELGEVEPLPSADMGADVARRHIDWLAGKSPKSIGSLQDGRFLDCPKRFQPHIHEDVDLSELDAWPVYQLKNDRVTRASVMPRQVMQAAWRHLIERARGELKPGERGISEVCLTYPADLMPEPRSALEEALLEIGITNVYLLFDESTAPAIFYLEQFIGNLEEIGAEAFKVDCVQEGNIWTHHMLVFDLGAGTTDISLIRLELEEVLPIQSEFGGRLYIVRPRLLGAAGRQLSGGHQLTLKVFRVLKQVLANWLRVGNGGTSEEIVLDAENRDDPLMTAALNKAEEVLPTRYHFLNELRKTNVDPNSKEWAAERQKLERFHLLWEWAERLKIHLSGLTIDVPKVPLEDVLPEGYTTLTDVLRKLVSGGPYETAVGSNSVGLSGTSTEAGPNARRNPEFQVAHFQALARIAVERSVRLAVSLGRSALESYGKKVGAALSLQSLVLSGRASALPEVIAQFREKLVGPTLGVSPDRILFRDEYAKSATALGAWRGLHTYLSSTESVGRPERLNGTCKLDIQVQNLFYFLPTSYRLGTRSNALVVSIFEQYTGFKQHGTRPLGLIRSREFRTPDREEMIFRDDGDGDGQLCGRLVKETLPQLLGNRELPNRDLSAEVSSWQVRYEINHQRQLSALLIRPSQVSGQEANPEPRPIYDVTEKDDNPYTVVNVNSTVLAKLQKAKGACPFHLSIDPPGPGRTPLAPAETMIPIRCLAIAGQPEKLVAAWMGQEFRLPNLNREGKLSVYLIDSATNQLAQPPLIVTPNPKKGTGHGVSGNRFPFEVWYRLVLTMDGRLSLVIGEEPAYWETTDIYEWLTSPEGRIFRKDLTPRKEEVDWWRDHLSGRH